jgi:hypothetical protein
MTTFIPQSAAFAPWIVYKKFNNFRFSCLHESKYHNCCWILGSHSYGYDEFCILRYNSVYPLKISRRFGGTCRLHHQGLRIIRARNHLESMWFPWLILRPWGWWRHLPPNRQLTFSGLHGDISQNEELIITIVSLRNIISKFHRKQANPLGYEKVYWHIGTDRNLWFVYFTQFMHRLHK